MTDAQWRRTWAAVGVVSFVAFFLWVLGASGWDVVVVLQAAVSGLGPGAAAAIVGVGLTLTYQTTGIFNFAFGSMAAFCAYVLWQWAVPWGLPLWAGAAVTVLVVGPGLGALFERLVFRPLQVRAASTSEKLLATIAVFALVLGVTAVVWGFGRKLNAPLLFGHHAFQVGSFVVSSNTIGQVGAIAVCAAAVTGLLRYTRLGTQIRAVVDRRQLAELAGVRANRVAALAWGIGGGFAALGGVLYAPLQGLSPFGLTLLVLQTFSVAVIARLTNLGLAIVGGLGLGALQGMMVRVQPDIIHAWPGLQNMEPYLFALALPLFLLVWRDLDEVGSESTAAGLVSSSVGRRRHRRRYVAPGSVVAVAFIAIAYLVGPNALDYLQIMVALAIVFLSIVAVTGFSGHITLGQAAFAGTGAFLTVKLTNGALPHVPALNPVLAMLLSAVVVMALGLVTAYPAIRRRGLILGLATLAVNLIVYFMLFENDYFLGNTQYTSRPTVFGLSLDGERAFYFYELVVLAVALVVTGSLRSGRLGRVLGAMRDSETGATSVGISMRRYKLVIFAASSALAAVGGSLLAQQAQTFNPEDWSPMVSMFWFLAVVFAGLSYLSGAVVGAALTVTLNALAGRDQAAYIIIGFLTLLTISFLRGGLVGWLLSLGGRRRLPRGLRERYVSAVGVRPAVPSAARATGNGSGPGAALVPTELARKLLQGAGR